MKFGQAHISILLVLVSAPVLIDWAQHLASHSWAWYSLAFPILLFLVPRQGPPGKQHVASALAVTASGLLIQFGALASGVARFGRPGFALCIAGILLLNGRAQLRNLVLLALCVPIPTGLVRLLSETPLEVFAKVIAATHTAFGIPSSASGHQISLPGHAASLHWTDLGISTGLLAFGLTWFACIIRRVPILRMTLTSAAAAACGIGIHLAITLAVLGLSTLDDPNRVIRDLIALGMTGAFCLWRQRLATLSSS